MFIAYICFAWLVILTVLYFLPLNNLIPSKDNKYTLGLPDKRWKSVYLGEGTVYITDTTLGTPVGITIDNGVFFIDGIAQAQLPDLKVSNLTFDDENVQNHSSDILLIDNNPGYLSGSSEQTTVDLSKQVLYMHNGEYWNLPDGIEGQIMHFVLGDNETVNDRYLFVNNLRQLESNSGIKASLFNNVNYRPFIFENGKHLSTLCTGIFVNGAWSFTNGAKE